MGVYFSDETVTLHLGDALEVARGLPAGSVDCIVTSPPYFGLRDYGVPGQYGVESSVLDYVDRLRLLFAELRRVLADDGAVWLNLGDTYSTYRDSSAGRSGGRSRAELLPARANSATGIGRKQLLGVPWRVALALQDDGWILRGDVVWSKPNGLPERVADRPMRAHEYLFLLSKRRTYWFDASTFDGDRSVWDISVRPFPGAHFATMPPELAARCVRSACRPGGVVLDPFSGSGTTGAAATASGRRYVGIDLSRDYLDLSIRTRLQSPTLGFEVAE